MLSENVEDFFPQAEGLNKSFIDEYHSLSKFVANLRYKSRSILLQNMMNVWIVLCIGINCFLTFQLSKEPTLFISMSTINIQ